MKLEQQLIPLPQARRLDELGFKTKTRPLFVRGIGGDKCETEWTSIYIDDDAASYEEYYYTYTVSELMDALPARVIIEDVPRCIDVGKNNDGTYYVDLSKWMCGLLWGAYFENTNLAEALSDMLIWLIENDLLPIPEK